MELLKMIATEKNVLLYRPDLNFITGSVTATILFQQLIYWDDKNDHKAFYKFISPCNHRLYRDDDSWIEELSMSKKEFQTAYKKLENLGLVEKKINIDRVTFYRLNAEKVEEELRKLFSNLEELKKRRRELLKKSAGISAKTNPINSVSAKRDLPKNPFEESDNFEDKKSAKNMQKTTENTSQSPKSSVSAKRDLPKQTKGTYAGAKGDLVYSKSFDTETTTETTTDIIKKIKQKSPSFYTQIDSMLNNYNNINLNAFFEWLEYRNINNILVATKILQMLNRYEKQVQQKMVDNSIMGEYKSLFEIQEPSTNKNLNRQEHSNSTNPILIFTQEYEKSQRLDYAYLEASKGLSYKEIDKLDDFKKEFELKLIEERINNRAAKHSKISQL